ncbi:hypothetical protein HZS_2941 [Henneguya salminicola]|nr:hypothetical protein HZS_2941 [Henneguya salminicola]
MQQHEHDSDPAAIEVGHINTYKEASIKRIKLIRDIFASPHFPPIDRDSTISPEQYSTFKYVSN